MKSAEQDLALVKEVNVDVSLISHGQRARANLRMLAHYSPVNHHLKVSTSTLHAKVSLHRDSSRNSQGSNFYFACSSFRC